MFTAHSMDAMIYADDTQFYIALKDTNRSESLQRLQHCIDDIRPCSTLNKLVLNDGKTEIIHIISSFASQAPTLPLAIRCGSSTIIPKPEAQSLGLTIDNNLLLKSHVNNICRSAFCALTNIGKIRKFLDQKTSASLVNALVISRLDHCNSLLIGLPQYELQKLQKGFNTAARIVTRTRPDAHITPVLKLVYLNMNSRNFRKVSTLLHVLSLELVLMLTLHLFLNHLIGCQLKQDYSSKILISL